MDEVLQNLQVNSSLHYNHLYVSQVIYIMFNIAAASITVTLAYLFKN